MIDPFDKLRRALKYVIIVGFLGSFAGGCIIGYHQGLKERLECTAISTEEGWFLYLPTIKREEGLIGPFEDYTDALWSGYDMGCYIVRREKDNKPIEKM
jgi:hypothetical protein